MADFGVTVDGFNKKRLNEILDDLKAELKSIFGENFDLSDESPDGQRVGIHAGSYADLWEIGQEAYNAYNPSAATGNALSNLVQINAIERLEATASRALIDITGDPSTLIPEGSLISTSDTGVQFATEEDVTIGGGGTAQVFAAATETGPIQASAGTITEIDTIIAGWDTATNASDAILGSNVETDAELRARRKRSVTTSASSVVDAIFAAVSNVDGVESVTVLENDTNLTDANGLPAHNIHVIVLGGVDDDIAEQIFIKKPSGVPTFGTETIEIFDDQGIGHDINFDRPTAVDVYVTVNLTTFSDYPANGDDLIKQAIVDYANGELVAGRGFGLGDDVIFTELYTPINTVLGHQVDSLFIDTSPSPAATNNIVISSSEVASFDIANIAVNS